MDSAERLGVLGTLRSLGVLGTTKQLMWGEQNAGISTTNLPRFKSRIDPSYKDMVERYLAEGRVKCAIDELGDISVGAGIYLTCAEGHEETKEFVDNFLEEINLDGINMMISKELWMLGGCLLWERTPEEFTELYRIPMYTITKIDADRFGNVTDISQKVEGYTEHEVSKKQLKELRYWSMNPIDTGVLGRGLMEAYVRRGVGYKWKDASTNRWKTAHRPSLAEMNEEIEDMMRVAITKYAPKYLIDLAGFNETQATAIKDRLGEVAWYDDVVVWYDDAEHRKMTPHRLSTDPRSRLDPFIEHFKDKELITMETPSVKLISETGFTEASSRTAERIELRKVAAHQRYLKRQHERYTIKAILMNGSLDGTQLSLGKAVIKEANIRMHFGEETRPELTFAELHKARLARGISLMEYRKNLAKFGMELDAEGLKELEAELAEAQKQQEEWSKEEKNGNNDDES